MIVVHCNNTSEYLPIIVKYQNTTFLGIGITDKLTVYNSGKGDMNLEACTLHNPTIINYTSNNETIVSNVGDIGVYFGIKDSHSGWCRRILRAIQLYLITKGLSAVEKDSDLTLYDKKILGYTEHINQDYSYGLIFISMVSSQELVRQICLRPKIKATTGLNDYGISANEIIELIIKITNNYIDDTTKQKGETNVTLWK